MDMSGVFGWRSKKTFSFDQDAVSDGQLQSKLWLLTELAQVRPQLPARVKRIAHLAGWNGLLGFLLCSRQEFSSWNYILIDRDLQALRQARHLNSSWRHLRRYEDRHSDIHSWLPSELTAQDLVVNTSVEHFSSDRWFDLIPAETVCVLQSTDLVHHEHVSPVSSLSELRARFPRIEPIFQGERTFDYGPVRFNRFMLIGVTKS